MISPALFNVALHGMEQAAGVRYVQTGPRAGRVHAGSPTLVRYADDFVVMCDSREQAEQVKARLAAWLAPRGLAFNEDKTRIVHVDDGLDFLGFNVRRYDGKLLIKPSKAALRRIRERLRSVFKALRGANAAALLRAINPIVRGWSAYYRTVVSSKAFAALDHYVFKLAYKWATRGHPNKPKHWIVKKYFGRFNKARQDRWVFGEVASGAYLRKFAWTKIVRHQLVPGGASPDDPALAAYWAKRRRKGPPLPVDTTTLRLLMAQHGRCPLCRCLLLHAEQPPSSPREWEQWLRTTRKAVRSQQITSQVHGTPDALRYRLTHADCQRRHDAANSAVPALLPAGKPSGLA